MTSKFPYTWSNHPCVRCGEAMYGEKHPCYYCGAILEIDESYKPCKKCEFAPCPNCGICLCNASIEVRSATMYLRDKYCCTLPWFQIGIEDLDQEKLKLVPNFEKALTYCRKKRGFLR